MFKVVCLEVRRLKCGVTGPKSRYLQKCEKLFHKHKMYIKARRLYLSVSYPTLPGFTVKIHKLDHEREQYMKNAENKCRKRRMGGVDFSPEVIVWKKRRDVLNSVIRWHKETWLNRTILKIMAMACGIQRPTSTILPEANRAYRICID